METPPPTVKRKRPASPPSDSPATSHSPIFDINNDNDDSPLTSALTLSPISDYEPCRSGTGPTPSKRRKASTPDRALAENARLDADAEVIDELEERLEAFKYDYATAAVSRPRRRRGPSPRIEQETTFQHSEDEEHALDHCESGEEGVSGTDHGAVCLDDSPNSVHVIEHAGECLHTDLGVRDSAGDEVEDVELHSDDNGPSTPADSDEVLCLEETRSGEQQHDPNDSDSDYDEGQSGSGLTTGIASSSTRHAAAEGRIVKSNPRRATRGQKQSQTLTPNITSKVRPVASASNSRPSNRKAPSKSKPRPRVQKEKAQSKSRSIARPRAISKKKRGTLSLFVRLKCCTEVHDQTVPSAFHSKRVQEHELYPLVERLFKNRNPTPPKPAPAGKPEVWADGRQELCETLHYYRSYQSACYSTGGFVRAFMFDKIAHTRDYMDNDVIISRAGGGLSKDKESGEMLTNKDQGEDTVIVQGLKNCINHYDPVVMITGKDNPTSPSQPPHQYCVLDYFKPTHVWVEKSNEKKILRYRFEKLSSAKESWWRPKDEEATIKLGSLEEPIQHVCNTCNVASLQIYLNGWMCLQPSCNAFWRIIYHSTSGSCTILLEPDEATLVYDPRFLKQKVPWPNDDHAYSLTSSGPELSSYAIPGEDTSQAFWSGIVCPDCGRCVSRLSWMSWTCPNPTCTFVRTPSHTLIPAASLQESFWPLTPCYTLSRDIHVPLITVKVTFAHNYRINRYQIPGLDGFITHMIANKTVVSEAGGADAMFEELQQQDIGLERRSMPNGQLKGDTYCRHFTVNYGMPYKFIAATASHSFAEAARPITATRSRLNWAAKMLLTQEDGAEKEAVDKDWDEKEFNEVLALGYFEQQKINYHDDGEYGLGPTIATLSLGAPGTMRIRMKARHYHGVTSTLYDDSRPLPGCQFYEVRTALGPELAALKESDKPAYRARLKEIPKELVLKASGNAKDVLRMELGHGDIVVMHGAELQKYYEHAVEHAGKLRFALTCRYIDPKSLKEEDRPGYVVERDGGGYDGSRPR